MDAAPFRERGGERHAVADLALGDRHAQRQELGQHRLGEVGARRHPVQHEQRRHALAPRQLERGARRPQIHRRGLHRHEHEARAAHGDARFGRGVRRTVDQHDVVAPRLALDFGRDAPAGDGRDLDVRRGNPAPLAPQAEPGRETRLRIDIDDRNPVARGEPRERQVRGERGLARAALLLRDGDDVGRHVHAPWRARHSIMAFHYNSFGAARPREFAP